MYLILYLYDTFNVKMGRNNEAIMKNGNSINKPGHNIVRIYIL